MRVPIILLIGFPGRCAPEQGILRAADTAHFQVTAVQDAGALNLRRTGLVFHSALGISRITSERDGRSMKVLVHLAMASESRTGNLDYLLEVPAGVNQVLFGPDEAVIWTR